MTPLGDGFPLSLAWEGELSMVLFPSCLDTLPSYEFPNFLCFYTQIHILGRKNPDVGSWDICDSSYCIHLKSPFEFISWIFSPCFMQPDTVK